MMITRFFPAGMLAALALTTLVAGCGDKERQDLNTRSDTGATRATPDQPATVPSASDTGTGLSAAPGQAAATPMTDAQILARMQGLNEMEVTEGNLALGRSTNDDVKSFAKMLVKDHGEMGTRGKKLAVEISVTPMAAPDDTTAKETSTAVTMLRGVPQPSFDSAFIAHEIEGHTKTLDLLKRMRGAAQNSALANVLDESIPTIQKHLEEAQKIQGKLGGK